MPKLGPSDGVWSTDEQAPGAIQNGVRVRKVKALPEDDHANGATGKVHGSIGPCYDPDLPDPYGYFVVWDDMPNVPVFIAGNRIIPIES